MGDDDYDFASDPSDFTDDGYSTPTVTAYGQPSTSADNIGALTNNQPTLNGTSNYQTDSWLGGSTGSVINSSANPVTTNSGPVDASGGNGSIPNVLQNIATQGLNDAVISAQEFGLGSLTDILRVGASGQTTAASAPSAPTTAVNSGLAGAGPLGLPWLAWIALGGVAIFLLTRK